MLDSDEDLTKLAWYTDRFLGAHLQVPISNVQLEAIYDVFKGSPARRGAGVSEYPQETERLGRPRPALLCNV